MPRTSPEWRPSGDRAATMNTAPLDPEEVLAALREARDAATAAQTAAAKAAKAVSVPPPRAARPKTTGPRSSWPWATVLIALILALGAAAVLITYFVLVYGVAY